MPCPFSELSALSRFSWRLTPKQTSSSLTYGLKMVPPLHLSALLVTILVTGQSTTCYRRSAASKQSLDVCRSGKEVYHTLHEFGDPADSCRQGCLPHVCQCSSQRAEQARELSSRSLRLLCLVHPQILHPETTTGSKCYLLYGPLFCRLLSSFQNNLDEITIIATPDDEDGGGQTHLPKAVQLHSFLDPAKGSQP